MENISCGLVILFLFPILLIGLGLVLIFKKDWAWWLVELVLSNVNPQRTTQWEHSTTINGVIMVVGGLGMIPYYLIKLPSMR